jgi:hypothetical protein
VVVAALMVPVMILTGAASCQAPPPDGWTLPELTAVELPSPVVAGEPFVVRVTVEDDELVDRVELSLQPDESNSGASGLQYVACEAPSFEPAEVVSVELTCLIPTSMPTGAWLAFLSATNVRWGQPRQQLIPFEVI